MCKTTRLFRCHATPVKGEYCHRKIHSYIASCFARSRWYQCVTYQDGCHRSADGTSYILLIVCFCVCSPLFPVCVCVYACFYVYFFIRFSLFQRQALLIAANLFISPVHPSRFARVHHRRSSRHLPPGITSLPRHFLLHNSVRRFSSAHQPTAAAASLF